MMKPILHLLAPTIIVVVLLTSTEANAQDIRITKMMDASGLSIVSGNSVRGFIGAGVPMAGGVSGTTMRGWIGIMPVKKPVPTSVSENETQQGVWPVPATDEVFIGNVAENSLVRIVTLDGANVDVLTRVINGQLRVDVSELTSGHYTVVISTKSTLRHERIVVVR